MQKYVLIKLTLNLNTELDIKASLARLPNGYYQKANAYKFSLLDIGSQDTLEVFPKIKNSHAMKEFEKVHSANCVLDKHQGRYVIKINY